MNFIIFITKRYDFNGIYQNLVNTQMYVNIII